MPVSRRQPRIRAVSLRDLLKKRAAAKTANGLLVHSPVLSRNLLICALTDLDGTANDERVPEHRRLSTISPAKRAFAILARSGVVTGICTARSTGEARQYQRRLNISGPLISENGAVVTFPDGTQRIFGNLKKLDRCVARISARLGRAIPNSIHVESLEKAWEKERRGKSPVFLGHPDRPSLRRAADRRASCFLSGLSPAEKKIAAQTAAGMGLTSFGELLHLIAEGVDKGRAFAALNRHLLDLPPQRGIRPEAVVQIVFGNGENDIPLFEQALKAGGCAVLVGDSANAGGFQFDLSKQPVPEGTILLGGASHGVAILRSLPLLKKFFVDRYGILFPW